MKPKGGATDLERVVGWEVLGYIPAGLLHLQEYVGLRRRVAKDEPCVFVFCILGFLDM